METMTVRAKSNPVPREDNSHRFITNDAPVEVPMSAYYMRRIADGELEEYAAPEPEAATRNDKTAPQTPSARKKGED